MAEDGHPDNCIDKSDERQQGSDIEKCRQGDNQREK